MWDEVASGGHQRYCCTLDPGPRCRVEVTKVWKELKLMIAQSLSKVLGQSYGKDAPIQHAPQTLSLLRHQRALACLKYIAADVYIANHIRTRTHCILS